MHDFCLLGADDKTKVVASSRKVIHTLLHFRFSVAVKSAVILKEEFSQCGYHHLCLCFESSEVEHSFISSVGLLQLDAIVIILLSILKHGSEYHAEEGRVEYTALFHSVCDWK